MVLADFVKNASIIIFSTSSTVAAFYACKLHEKGVLSETLYKPIEKATELVKYCYNDVCVPFVKSDFAKSVVFPSCEALAVFYAGRLYEKGVLFEMLLTPIIPVIKIPVCIANVLVVLGINESIACLISVSLTISCISDIHRFIDIMFL